MRHSHALARRERQNSSGDMYGKRALLKWLGGENLAKNRIATVGCSGEYSLLVDCWTTFVAHYRGSGDHLHTEYVGLARNTTHSSRLLLGTWR